MKYIELKKFIEENGASPIYVFEGEENYFHVKGEEMLRAKFVQEPTLDYATFDGNTLKGEKIKGLLDALRAIPFISEKRFVRVTEFFPTEKDFDGYLKGYFENPAPDSILLIVNTGKGKAGTVNWQKKPNVTYVDCGRSDEETIKKWIYLTCKKEGVYADGIVCGKLAGYCLFDMARISKETEKLLTYCKGTGKEKWTDEMVDLLVYPDAEYKIFELANALSRKNYSSYIKISKELLSHGFNETTLLSSLVSYFKGIYEVSVSRGSDREIALALGMKEYSVKKNREQARSFADGEALGLYNAVYEAVSKIKCGELSPDSAWKKVTAELFFQKV